MRNLNFRNKLLASIVSVTVVSIAVLMVITNTISSRSTLQLLETNMDTLVQKTMDELDSWLTDREREALILSENKVLRDALLTGDYTQASDFLKSYFGHSPVLENLFIASTAGVIVADGVDGNAVGLDVKAIPEYTKNIDMANQGEFWTSEVQASPVTGRPVVLMTAPVFENGKVIGMVGTPIELMNFSDTFVSNTKIGESGYVVLTDKTGTTLAHPDKELILNVNFTDYDFGRVILAMKNGTYRYTWEGANKQGFFQTNPQNGWVVLATVTTDEFLAPIKNMMYVTSGMAIIAVLLLSIVIWFSTSKIFNGIKTTVSGLIEASSQLSSASSQVSAASQSLSESASEQASSLEETSSSLEEISSMAKQNAMNSITCDNEMNEAGKLFTVIDEKMNSLIHAVEDIDKNSQNTQKIIKTIDEIAFQTNLLALNAAVEAARAGEAGAGFAVVADEVRNLAMRAAEAARNTQELIGETVHSVKNGSGLLDDVRDVLGKNMNIGGKVATLVKEISTASNEQAQGIEQVNVALSQMDQLTQTMAANSEESASTSEELSSQASELYTYIDVLAKMIGGSDTTAESKVEYRHVPKVNEHTSRTLKKLSPGKKQNIRVTRMETAEDVIPLDEQFESF